MRKTILSVAIFAFILSPMSVNAATYNDDIASQIREILMRVVELQYRVQNLKHAATTPLGEVAGATIHPISVEWTKRVIEEDDDGAIFYMDFGGNTPASYRMHLICDEDVIDVELDKYGDGCGDSVTQKWSPQTPERFRQRVQLDNFSDNREKVTIEFTLFDAAGKKLISDRDSLFVEPTFQFQLRRDVWRWN